MVARRSVFIIILFLISSLTVFAQSDEKMNPEAGTLYNQGNEKLKAGNYTEAIKLYDQALTHQKDYRIFYQKGIALKKANKLQDAKDAFSNSIKENSTFDLAYNGLGSTEFQLGNLDAAIENFQKFESSTKKESNKKSANEYIARCYTKKGSDALNDGNHNKAIELLTKAVSHNNYDAAYLSLAKVYVETSQYDKAIDAANKALKYRESISKGGPYYYLGIAYKNLGDLTKAKESFQACSSDATYKKTAEYELTQLK